jgi:hypothetical protein
MAWSDYAFNRDNDRFINVCVGSWSEIIRTVAARLNDFVPLDETKAAKGSTVAANGDALWTTDTALKFVDRDTEIIKLVKVFAEMTRINCVVSTLAKHVKVPFLYPVFALTMLVHGDGIVASSMPTIVLCHY